MNTSRIMSRQKCSKATNRYFKFSDGTLICDKGMSTNAAYSTAWGKLYETANISLGNWKYSFKEAPVVVAQVYANINHYNGGTAEYCWALHEGITRITATSAGIVCFARPNQTSGRWSHIVVLAIGRWK